MSKVTYGIYCNFYLTCIHQSWSCYFLKDFIYLFLEKGKERRDRERNINVWLPFAHPLPGTWPATQACAPTGNRTGDPLVHRLALNPLSHTSQGMILLFLFLLPVLML